MGTSASRMSNRIRGSVLLDRVLVSQDPPDPPQPRPPIRLDLSSWRPRYIEYLCEITISVQCIDEKLRMAIRAQKKRDNADTEMWITHGIIAAFAQ